MKIDPETIEILEQCTTDKNKVFLPDIKLDRKLYVKVNKVLESLQGKWNRKEKAHLFNTDTLGLLETAILNREVTDIKQELQFFPTPENIVDVLIEKANLKKGMTVLEPSAGRGAIAKKLVDIGCEVTVCEKHEPFRKELIEMGNFKVLRNDDFLSVEPYAFDAVVANPPFTLQQDIDHVLHMIKFVDEEGGSLVSVMSNGVTFRQNKKTRNFHKTMDEKFNSWEIIELPKDSFKKSGTGVSSIVVVGRI